MHDAHDSKANDAGVYFPVQGHCMGYDFEASVLIDIRFELINLIISGNLTLLGRYDSENMTL